MQCDVTDIHGNHCPEESKSRTLPNGDVAYLCERCYTNVLNGAYGSIPLGKLFVLSGKTVNLGNFNE